MTGKINGSYHNIAGMFLSRLCGPSLGERIIYARLSEPKKGNLADSMGLRNARRAARFEFPRFARTAGSQSAYITTGLSCVRIGTRAALESDSPMCGPACNGSSSTATSLLSPGSSFTLLQPTKPLGRLPGACGQPGINLCDFCSRSVARILHGETHAHALTRRSPSNWNRRSWYRKGHARTQTAPTSFPRHTICIQPSVLRGNGRFFGGSALTLRVLCANTRMAARQLPYKRYWLSCSELIQFAMLPASPKSPLEFSIALRRQN